MKTRREVWPLGEAQFPAGPGLPPFAGRPRGAPYNPDTIDVQGAWVVMSWDCSQDEAQAPHLWQLLLPASGAAGVGWVVRVWFEPDE